jgi:hypothetical protein
MRLLLEGDNSATMQAIRNGYSPSPSLIINFWRRCITRVSLRPVTGSCLGVRPGPYIIRPRHVHTARAWHTCASCAAR